MSEKIADVIKETENNKADRQEQYFFRTDQLTVGYDGKPLIREINIQLKKGEILTLIGPNGAGKSTILKSITRQLATISGTVYLDKEKMAKMTNKEVSQKLAVVLTERMRPELMTCEDIVATGRYPYTGTLGILSAEDKTGILQPSVMVRDNESFLPGLSVRSRRSLYWMSRLLFWISVISWNFLPF